MGNSQSQWRFIARKIICKCRIFQLAYLMPYRLGYGGYGGTLVLGDWWVVLATTLWNHVKSQYCRWFAQYCHLYLSGNIRILLYFVYLYIASFLFAHDAWHTMRVRPLWSLFFMAGWRSRFLKVKSGYSDGKNARPQKKHTSNKN
jgi:hypothetical protein